MTYSSAFSSSWKSPSSSSSSSSSSGTGSARSFSVVDSVAELIVVDAYRGGWRKARAHVSRERVFNVRSGQVWSGHPSRARTVPLPPIRYASRYAALQARSVGERARRSEWVNSTNAEPTLALHSPFDLVAAKKRALSKQLLVTVPHTRTVPCHTANRHVTIALTQSTRHFPIAKKKIQRKKEKKKEQ